MTSHQNVEASEIEALSEVALSKTEVFFEENGKKITIAIFAIFVIAAALFGYKSLIAEPKEARAAEAIYTAQVILEGANPDYQVALDGNESGAGFLEVIEEFGSTASGNIANHYAGICYLKLGDTANASKYLKAYKAQKGIPAQIINAQNIALQGDVAVAEGNYSEAVSLYERAADVTENPLTTPQFLRKAGMAAQAAGDNAKAKELYESVVRLYPNSIESRNAEKYLGTIK